jgi:hypothetical protein
LLSSLLMMESLLEWPRVRDSGRKSGP